MADTTGFDFASFMKSPAGAALINSIGGGLSAFGQKQSEDANRQQNANQFAVNAYQGQSGQNASNAAGVLNANPLGADQKFAGSNALLAAILPRLRNQHTTPGDAAVASAMPTSTGGLRLPEQGFDPKMIQSMFGPDATMSSIATHQKNSLNLDPRAQTMDMGSMYGTPGATATGGVQDFRTQRLDDQAKQQALIQRAIDGNIAGQQQQDSGGGFWHTLAKIAGPVAGIASMAIPGLQPLGAMLLAGGGGAASAWGNGSGPGGIAAGAGLGAATARFSPKRGS